MRYDLAALVRQNDPSRRRDVVFAPIDPPKTLANDLARIMVKPIRFWRSRSPGILDAYARSLAVLPRDTAHVADAGEEITGELAAVAQESAALVLTLTPELRDWLVRVENWHTDRFAANALTATGIDLKTVLQTGDMTETVDAYFNRILNLITGVNDDTK
jgi:hypothetical protein